MEQQEPRAHSRMDLAFPAVCCPGHRTQELLGAPLPWALQGPWLLWFVQRLLVWVGCEVGNTQRQPITGEGLRQKGRENDPGITSGECGEVSRPVRVSEASSTSSGLWEVDGITQERDLHPIWSIIVTHNHDFTARYSNHPPNPAQPTSWTLGPSRSVTPMWPDSPALTLLTWVPYHSHGEDRLPWELRARDVRSQPPSNPHACPPASPGPRGCHGPCVPAFPSVKRGQCNPSTRGSLCRFSVMPQEQSLLGNTLHSPPYASM